MTTDFVDQTATCTYCKSDVKTEDFKSEFTCNIHYKTQDCPNCNRIVRVVVDFEGSGHDTWKGQKPFIQKKESGKIRTLEYKIQVVGAKS